eukprot:GHRR01032297.1.p1 GENE.GHRR01032297.1~~GHRR01032297.1.p1  ORF type:complete len:111 (+),score=29.89 GHRR01032297.1:677-1009(+)
MLIFQHHCAGITLLQVDPLDGTTNFVHGYPFICVSIGLTVNRLPVVGVVYNPVLGEMFTAAQGLGAYLNAKPLKASDTAGMLPGGLHGLACNTSRGACLCVVHVVICKPV